MNITHRQQQTALRSLESTGALPDGGVFAVMRARYESSPANFRANHPPILNTLVARDVDIEPGECVPTLLPETGRFGRLDDRRNLNPARFDHYHPFLGRLLALDEAIDGGLFPCPTEGEVPGMPTLPGSSDVPVVVGTPGEQVIVPVPTPGSSVPEPGGLGLAAVGLAIVMTYGWARGRR